MWNLRSITAKIPLLAGSTKAQGDEAEQAALQYLLAQGLRLVARNFKTPGRGGGEIDLIMREADGTLVFVEVRRRKSADQGGALASVTALKRQRIAYAARHYLSRLPHLPACRFDVLAVQGTDLQIDWVKAAFEAF